jgi:ankyrin repeat protein
MANGETEGNQPDKKGGSSTDYEAMLDVAQGAGEAEVIKVDQQPSKESPETQAEINPNVLRGRLDHALQKGTPEDLEELFDGGMDIDQEDHEGRTALMMTAAQGKKEAVEKLLARGADINRVYMYHDRKPNTALDAARQTGHEEIANILMGLGAKTGKEIAQEQANSANKT